MGAHSDAQRLLSDRTSGAAELALRATEILDRAAATGMNETQLARLGARMTRAHPAMGAVWNAVHAPDRNAFRRRLARSQAAVVKIGRRHLPHGATVLTLSYSSTVLEALARRDLSVLVAESQPGGEGRKMARRLRLRRVRARTLPDLLLAEGADLADVAIIGADAVTPKFVVNKMGTRLLAQTARFAKIPCYVLADVTKFVPGDWPLPAYSRRQPFDATARSLFTAVLSDER